MVMKSGIRAWTGKYSLDYGIGYLLRNLLNCRICLLQKDSTSMRGRNWSMVKGYVLVSHRLAASCFDCFFLIVIYLLACRPVCPW